MKMTNTVNLIVILVEVGLGHCKYASIQSVSQW